jgi:transcriptional regulator with XRE-family HTH domain
MQEQEAQLARRIGAAVREQRQLRGWSQEALAEKVDLSSHFIGLVERANQLPSLTTLLTLARTFGVGVDELLGHRKASAPAPWEREALAVFRAVPAAFRAGVIAMLRTLARGKRPRR